MYDGTGYVFASVFNIDGTASEIIDGVTFTVLGQAYIQYTDFLIPFKNIEILASSNISNVSFNGISYAFKDMYTMNGASMYRYTCASATKLGEGTYDYTLEFTK